MQTRQRHQTHRQTKERHQRHQSQRQTNSWHSLTLSRSQTANLATSQKTTLVQGPLTSLRQTMLSSRCLDWPLQMATDHQRRSPPPSPLTQTLPPLFSPRHPVSTMGSRCLYRNCLSKPTASRRPRASPAYRPSPHHRKGLGTQCWSLPTTAGRTSTATRGQPTTISCRPSR